MKKTKLNYRIHDPNPVALTTDCLLKLFVEVNLNKVELAIQRAADAQEERPVETLKGCLI